MLENRENTSEVKSLEINTLESKLIYIIIRWYRLILTSD
jgi:hypothetical protein